MRCAPGYTSLVVLWTITYCSKQSWVWRWWEVWDGAPISKCCHKLILVGMCDTPMMWSCRVTSLSPKISMVLQPSLSDQEICQNRVSLNVTALLLVYTYLFVAVVECNPLHPPGRWWRRESGLEAFEVGGSTAARASLNLFLFFMLRPAILWAARSRSKSFGTLMRSNLGSFVMKNFLTQGAILCVLGFR